MSPTIFGREPVVISNAVEGLLTAALAFNMLNSIGIDSPEEIATVMAVVTALMGVYVAYATHDTLLAASIALVKASVLLFAAYGYNVSDHQLAMIVGLMTTVAAMWHRPQTGVSSAPSLNLSQHSPLPINNAAPVVNENAGVTEVTDGVNGT